MEFLKKNWGLLLCFVIFLAAAIYLSIKIVGIRGEYAANQAKVAEHEAWFKKVNSDGWKITPGANNQLENAGIARQNKETAEAHLTAIHDELIRRYSFAPELPTNDAQAKDMLNRKLRSLAEMVINKKVRWEAEYMGGPLNDLATQSEKINHEDFKPIFRQLLIYERLTQIIVNSDVKAVTKLAFPHKWTPIEDNGDYTVTPVLIGAIADPVTLQKLVNNLLADPQLLCIIRSISFELPTGEANDSELTDAALEKQNNDENKLNLEVSDSNGNSTGVGGNSRRNRDNDAMMGGTSTRSTRKATRSTRNSADMGMGGAGMGGSGSISEEDLVPENPKRQDYLVFKTPRQLHLKLNLDIIEYVVTEEE